MDSDLLAQFLAALRRETVGSIPSPVSLYLARLAESDPKGAELLRQDIAKLFRTPEGIRVLMLLRDSVLLAEAPAEASDRALRELNAQRNIVNDIRRLVAHGP